MNTIPWREPMSRDDVMAFVVGAIWGLLPMMVSLWIFG